MNTTGNDLGPDPLPTGAPMSRRDFLGLITTAMAAAMASGCVRQPPEGIVPYVRQPEGLVPGTALHFATAMELGGIGRGLLVRSDDGRPTKIEGNPRHPASRGRTDLQAQAALLTLYDAERSREIRSQGLPSTWSQFLAAQVQSPKEGLRLLTRNIGSPTLLAQIQRLLQKFPGSSWHVHDAAFPAAPIGALPHFDKADVILSLDADFLSWPDVSCALDFALRRRPEASMNRLYVVETMPSVTGSMADHRRAIPPSELHRFAEAALSALDKPAADPWLRVLADDLLRKRSLVVTGPFQSKALHQIAMAMNERLGNVGDTIEYTAPDAMAPSSMAQLVADMHSGAARSLLILEANPAYDAPADFEFAAAMAKVPFSVHHGLYHDETAALAHWHLPGTHFLESWSDTRSADGSAAIIQPLINPLFGARSEHELLAAYLSELPAESYSIVRRFWQGQRSPEGFEAFWRSSLQDGVIPGTANPPISAQTPASAESSRMSGSGLELHIRPDPHLLDGRFANNAWLQEMPKPLTTLTWENAAHTSPKTAAAYQLEHGDLVELRYRGRKVLAPLWVLPGHAENSVTIHLGYGRERAGSTGTGLGFNAATLQFSDAPWGGPGLELEKVGRAHPFASTQGHQNMEEREPVRSFSLENPSLAGHESSLYPEYRYDGPAWAMVIDLSTCIGCGTCTLACQVENNIPVVGAEQVRAGREMHWIRVDRYFSGPSESPQMLHQPVPCMHCEKAPCELVCPVAATVHDHEGLNLMVYNRCVGTRYCSNNCPYKVRRFNFFAYADNESAGVAASQESAGELRALGRNPQVSVRSRGVMEKCTYCLQRIVRARITARNENRPIAEGEVVPACAQACPADAIIFGDLTLSESRVRALREQPRHYTLLADLNTQPRTTYLARAQNPNPEISS